MSSVLPSHTLAPRGAIPAIVVLSAVTVLIVILLSRLSVYSSASAAIALSIWVVISLLGYRGLDSHPHQTFGVANIITCVRASLTSVLMGWVLVAGQTDPASAALWYLTLAALIALCLDGVDGWLARTTGMTSAFGARFDMEVDSLLILVLAMIVWQSDLADSWILGLGIMRYAFVAASLVIPELSNPLFPSMRRKVVCVIQVAALCLILVPWIERPLSSYIGFFALVCLAVSFARDCIWLLGRKHSLPAKDAHKNHVESRKPTQRFVRKRKIAKPGTQPVNDINA